MAYIGDYLKEREGQVWTPEDTLEVLRVLGEIDRTWAQVCEQRAKERVCEAIRNAEMQRNSLSCNTVPAPSRQGAGNI